MWNLLLSVLVPLAIKLGVEAVLSLFPNMPQWVKDILNKLAADKAMAAEIPCPKQRKAAVYVAKAKARQAIKEGLKG